MYQEKLTASMEITRFMGELALRYNAKEMHRLWWAKDEMCKRYGVVFVAKTIQKDKKDAELALIRYSRNYVEPKVTDYEVIEPPVARKRRTARYGRTVASWAIAIVVALVFCLGVM